MPVWNPLPTIRYWSIIFRKVCLTLSKFPLSDKRLARYLFPKFQVKVKFIVPFISRFNGDFTENSHLIGVNKMALDQFQHRQKCDHNIQARTIFSENRPKGGSSAALQ